jgi:hypothetical protein
MLKNAGRVRKPDISQRGKHLKKLGENFIYNKATKYLKQNKSLLGV